ncbi:MAG: transaldolase [Actinomycetota bacterium]
MNILERISARGQSIWFDDLRRELLSSGELARLVAEDSVTGVTTNPTILARAISESSDYDAQLEELVATGAGAEEIYADLVTSDIRAACDVLRHAWETTGGADGFVSVEVSPRVADDAASTISEVRDWVKRVDRDNLLVKVPATTAGAIAFEELTAEGVSVNVTLIFSLERYRDIAERYVHGIERFAAGGGDPRRLHSVASFFVSRVDTEVDKRLAAIGDPSRTAPLRGKAGIANARVAYGIFEDTFSSEKWLSLAERGANVQRPLWASTGVKDPAYPDTMYVDALIAPRTVDTMPLATLRAVADHGDPNGGSSAEDVAEARAVLAALERVGVPYDEVTATIEREGLEKFSSSFEEVMSLLGDKVASGGAT